MTFKNHFKKRNIERKIDQLERSEDHEEIIDCARVIYNLCHKIYKNPTESPYRKEYILSKGILENISESY